MKYKVCGYNKMNNSKWLLYETDWLIVALLRCIQIYLDNLYIKPIIIKEY